LDIETLARLAGIKVSTQEVSIDDKRSVSEPRPVFGFNTAAGARRSSAGAIKRGSAFVLGNSRTALAPLFAALAAREAVGLGLGERQEEGFGRFALNHPAHRPPFEQTKATAGAGEEGAGGVQDAESRARRVREEAIGEALDTVSREGLQNLCVQNDFPARGQWQQLRHKVEVVADVSDLNALFDTLRSRAGDFSGKMWACPTRGKPLWKMIDDRRRQEGELPWQRAFLIYLCRWVVAELDRLRREEKGD